MIRFDAFPGGKQNAVTFSYDDGKIGDIRLMEIFRRYGIKGTFHIFNRPVKELTPEELAARYEGFEVSAHGKVHYTLTAIPKISVLEEMLDNRKLLERAVHYPVIGMSYANGGYNPSVIDLLRHLGFVYARTTKNTMKFTLPEDFMEWHPTCHHRDGMECAERFLNSFDGYFSTPRLLYIWGHSHEIVTEEDWAYIEALCAKLANNDRIWYATNMEIYEYLTAQRSLITAADESFVYNPTLLDVWFSKDGEPYCVKSGETLYF